MREVGGGEPVGSSKSDRTRRSRGWRRRTAVAAAGYSTVAVFGIAYLVSKTVLPGVPETTALIAATLAAAPLALAFVWERIASLRLLGVEVALTQASLGPQEIGSISEALSPEHVYYSDNLALLRQFGTMIGARSLRVLEINMRLAPYWWSTRLYLVAALAIDFSTVEHVVFVDRDAERRFVGITPVRTLKAALARKYPFLEPVYCALRSGGSGSSADEVERIVLAWTASQFLVDGVSQAEQQARVELSTDELEALVEMDKGSIEWDEPLDSPLLQDLVLERGTPLVALTVKSQLHMIVDAAAYARQVALGTIRSRLSS
jgi:hypothetical protein